MPDTQIIKLTGSIQYWIDALDKYSFDQLLEKPSDEKWSMGQLYMHLLYSTRYCIKNINACLSSNENENETPNEQGRAVLQADGFPDIRIEGPPTNKDTPQPVSHEKLMLRIKEIAAELTLLWNQSLQSEYKGRSYHFRLGFLDVQEWFQFCDIHFRHHLRQKKRIDEFLLSKEKNES